MKTLLQNKLIIFFVLLLFSIFPVSAERPVWVDKIVDVKGYVLGVGYANMQSRNASTSAAETRARTALAKNLDSLLINSLSYTDGYYEKYNYSLKFYEESSQEIISYVIRGVRIQDKWTDEDGTVWILVSLDKKLIPQMVKDFAEEKKKEKQEEIVRIYNSYLETYSKIAEMLGDLKNKTGSTISDLKTAIAAIDSQELYNRISEIVTMENKQ